MNDELTKRVFDWVSATAEKIGDFAGKEIPPFITEYLTWKFWENILNVGAYFFGLIVFIIIILSLFKLTVHLWTKAKEIPHSDYDLAATVSSALTMVGFLTCAVYFVINFPLQSIFDCVQIKIAPKVYLVERAAELYKEAKK